MEVAGLSVGCGRCIFMCKDQGGTLHESNKKVARNMTIKGTSYLVTFYVLCMAPSELPMNRDKILTIF
jgi:hypothetical protein